MVKLSSDSPKKRNTYVAADDAPGVSHGDRSWYIEGKGTFRPRPSGKLGPSGSMVVEALGDSGHRANPAGLGDDASGWHRQEDRRSTSNARRGRKRTGSRRHARRSTEEVDSLSYWYSSRN